MSTEKPQCVESPLTNSVEKLRHELDRWLDVAWSQGERAMDAFGMRGNRAWTPPADVVERDDGFEILFNIPGVAPDAVELSVAGHMLTIEGEFPPVDATGSARVQVTERPHGRFKRSIPLPPTINGEDVRAECQLGVLRVCIGKLEQEKARRIPVGAKNPS